MQCNSFLSLSLYDHRVSNATDLGQFGTMYASSAVLSKINIVKRLTEIFTNRKNLSEQFYNNVVVAHICTEIA